MARAGFPWRSRCTGRGLELLVGPLGPLGSQPPARLERGPLALRECAGALVDEAEVFEIRRPRTGWCCASIRPPGP